MRGALRKSTTAAVVLALAAFGVITGATVAGAGPSIVSVPAAGSGGNYYTDSGVFVPGAGSVSVSASGSWAVDPNFPATGPAGFGFGFSVDIAPSAGYQALVGSTDGGASWFAIGTGPTSVNGPGELLLAANDNAHFCAPDNCYADNTGAVTAVITSTASILTITPGVDPATVAATSAAGAHVYYATPTASNSSGSVSVLCDHASGAVFPIGHTTVTCTANGAPGDTPTSVQTTLTVTVIDTTLAIAAGANPPAVATTDPNGAPVTFAVPAAHDWGGAVAVVCDHPSGSVFPLGPTTVTCTANGGADDQPATAQTTLTVSVVDGALAITPGASPRPVLGTSPTSGAPVTFTLPTASDLHGPVPVVCDRPSGSWFPIGTTVVHCSATKAGDNPASVNTSLTVTVYLPPTAPDAPKIGTATAGNGSASVTFDPPPYDGSKAVTSYTVTCSPVGGGTSRSESGPYSPLTVSGLSNGTSYSCTATATNAVGTSPPSDASNTVVPTGTVSCLQDQTCTATVSTPNSRTAPPQTVRITGIPTADTGTVTVTSAPAQLNCPGIPPALAAVTTLTDTGIPASSSLKATVTQFAVATGPGRVCYNSDVPFKSVSHPKTPKAGTFLLLQCSEVANAAPCQVSSNQTAKAIVVKFLAPGGDPTFRVVVPHGRLVWPSTVPTGKVGTPYGANLQSTGGKAPFHWKLGSGKLAPGLALNPSTGAITGKPTAKGTFTCLVSVTDSEAPPKSATISVSIKIS